MVNECAGGRPQFGIHFIFPQIKKENCIDLGLLMNPKEQGPPSILRSVGTEMKPTHGYGNGTRTVQQGRVHTDDILNINVGGDKYTVYSALTAKNGWGDSGSKDGFIGRSKEVGTLRVGKLKFKKIVKQTGRLVPTRYNSNDALGQGRKLFFGPGSKNIPAYIGLFAF